MANSSDNGGRRPRSDASRLVPLGMMIALAACTGPAGPTGDLSDDPALEKPGYVLTIREGSQRIAEVAQPINISIDITREPGGYEGPITFVAEAPEGIVVGFRPATVLRDFTDVILVADGGVEPRDHQVVFRGTVPGHVDQTVTLTLSLRPKS